jgi:hypothetical protein
MYVCKRRGRGVYEACMRRVRGLHEACKRRARTRDDYCYACCAHTRDEDNADLYMAG